MSKLFKEWDKKHNDFIVTKEEIWVACKAAAIEILRANIYTAIWEEKSWEEVFKDL